MQNTKPTNNEVDLLRQGLVSVLASQNTELRFFEMSLDMLCTASLDTGHFVRLNPTWSRTLGYTEDELHAQPFVEFVHPDDRAATIEAASELATGNSVVSFMNRYRTKSGEYRWIEWMSTVNLEQRLIYAVARDVTARKQTEEALRESEQRTRELLIQIREHNAQLQRQSEVLRQLATPVIPLAKEVIAIPIIGDIDPERAEQIIESMTQGVSDSRALVALIDLTGVRQIDNHGANALLRVAQSTRLLGCITVFTGIGPNIAQTLVALDVNLRNLVTYSTLQEGIEFAFRFAREARIDRRSARSRRVNS